jgi:cob(I)alamin adenosyltransferase
MLYTRKGDSGTTRTLRAKAGRISKSSCQIEALGALDELNSFLGLAKVKCVKSKWRVNGEEPQKIIEDVQDCLFTIQAEVAGSDKKVSEKKVKEMEEAIAFMEKEMPPIKSFSVTGGTELSAIFDIGRTLARKAERRIVQEIESNKTKVDPHSLAYMNRLSSLLFALARYVNYRLRAKERPPCYN